MKLGSIFSEDDGEFEKVLQFAFIFVLAGLAAMVFALVATLFAVAAIGDTSGAEDIFYGFFVGWIIVLVFFRTIIWMKNRGDNN